MICGTINDSWYGKIKTDVRKEIGYPQPSINFIWYAVHRLNVGWFLALDIKYQLINLRYSQTLSERIQDSNSIN